MLLIGGTAITLSGINWNIGIAAWIAPFFLLMYTRKAKWYQLFFFFLVMSISGAVSQTNNNLFHLASVNIINGLTFGIVFTIVYGIDKALYKQNAGFYFTLLFPSLIVLIEFVLTALIGTWGIIAHTQYEMKSLLQLSSVTGVFGISFMVVWFSSVVYWLVENSCEWCIVKKGVLIYISILFLTLLYGELRLEANFPKGKTVKVAAVMSETDIQEIAANEKSSLEKLAADRQIKIPARIFSDSLAIKTLITRTYEASEQGAKIIVWNEIALILNQDQKQQLISEIQSICINERVYVLLAFLETCSDPEMKPFNNMSIFIDPLGKVVWKYMKSYLHYAETPIINRGDFNIPVVETEYGKISNVICYDLDMNSYIKQAGKKAIDIMLVPAEDWPGITPLHSRMACLEAIQYGFSLVRSNGKGLTAAYDYLGNTIASVNTLTSDTKIMYADVPVRSVKTFYFVIGNIIVCLAIMFLLFLVLTKIIRRK